MDTSRLMAELRPHVQRVIKTSAATGCRVIRSSAQTIANNAVTALSFSTLTDLMNHSGTGCDSTEAGCWAIGAPTKLVCVTAGWYMAGGGVGFTSAAGAYRQAIVLSLYNSSNTLLAALAQNENHVAASTSSYISVSTGMFYMHTGDYVTVSVYQNTGANKDTAAATLASHIGASGWMARIA